MAIQIQDRCWVGKRPFTIDEVHVARVIRPDGGAEGALTLKMRPDVSLDEDVLVGTLLAFFIGNSMSQGQGEALRWCPVLSGLGVSSCEVTQITARRGTRLPTRKQIRFGHQLRVGRTGLPRRGPRHGCIMHDEQRPWVVRRQEWEVAISTKHKLLMLN